MRTIQLPNRRLRIPQKKSGFWHAHTHSNFSYNDAISPVDELVRRASELDQPALGLTDHGNMAGAIQLYQACREEGIAPFPGTEAYLKRDARDKDAPRYHIGLLAFTTEGYEALVRLSSNSHTRERFHHKPHVDFTDFAEWAERGWTQGLALTTGCYFGMVTQTLIDKGMEAAEWLIKTLAQWFPHTYVELQHHHIDHEGVDDDYIVEALHSIAQVNGLPVVITQDAHYCRAREKPLHETLKRLVSWGPDSDDAVFPGDSFHLADENFVASHYDVRQWRSGSQGLGDLLSKHSLVIPELESYHYKVPQVTAGDPLKELETRAWDFLLDNGFIERGGGYEERYDEELDVVRYTDMAGYLMLVAEVCDWMREQSVFFQARGSASGSLLCWALGITQEDPIADGLRYERFLSKDRTKPPDVDLDIDDTRRDEVISMLESRFNVCQIGTWAEYGVYRDTGRGSLFVAYMGRKRRNGEDPKFLNSIQGVYDLPANDRDELFALGEKQVRKSYGTHAAGLVVTSTKREFERLVPTMLVASSDTTVTQYEMDDLEALGLVKLDELGQKSLATIRRVTELMGRDVADGWDWIPLDDAETFRAIRRQEVDGVFQLEGWANKKGCKEMRVRSLRDIIHLVALYRPATMETGVKDAYVRRLAGWEDVPKRNPILDHRLKETYGLPVFQDQVISILRDLGFTPDQLTEFLKAVKASNKNIGDAGEVIQRYKEVFGGYAQQSGWSQEDMGFTWEAIEGFAEYGFNKAHATSYGKRAYRMAYLKTHHSLEFHTALLQTWAGAQKERDYIIATKEAGIKMLSPDVNISGATWSIDRHLSAIRKGLVSIKGIGERAATEIEMCAPYSSVDEIIDRCEARAVSGGKSWHCDGTLNGVLGKLKDAGALKSLGVK